MANATCSIDGCDRQHMAKGLCGTHYMRLRRTGGTADPKPSTGRDRGACAVEGCDGTDYRRGWCHKHYERVKRYGDPLTLRRQRNDDPPETCTVPGCGAPYRAKGMCKVHYLQAWHAEHREERNAAGRARFRANPDAYTLRADRRRRRLTDGMDDFDLELSNAYRQAIANDPCRYCGAPADHVDHIFPVALGGTDHWWNLTRACEPCNKRKAAHCGTWFSLRADLAAVA